MECSHCSSLVVGQLSAMHRTCRAEARPETANTAVNVQPADNHSRHFASVGRIMLANRPAQKHVPASCRSLWSAVMGRAISSVVLCNVGANAFLEQRQRCDIAWAELMSLRKAVLASALLKGKKHHRAQGNYTRCKLQSLFDGER